MRSCLLNEVETIEFDCWILEFTHSENLHKNLIDDVNVLVLEILKVSLNDMLM